MRPNLVTLSLSLSAIVLSYISPSPAADRQHVQEITTGEARYEIDVSGSIDPINTEILIENVGGEPVVNPRITVNGKYDWYTLESMAAEITAGAATDEEKAHRIFKFVTDNTYWWYWPSERTRLDPIRHFNVYGYHICSDAAAVYVKLCRAAGLQARVMEIWHHTVTEVFYDGAWHHMDPDIGLWYIGRDNKTIASIAELEKDPDIIRRIDPYYRWVWSNRDDRYLIYQYPDREHLATIYSTARYNYEEHGYDSQMNVQHPMDITLRSGESISRSWFPSGKYFDKGVKMEPPRYANGKITFIPDFRRNSYSNGVLTSNVEFGGEDELAVQVKDLQDPVYDQPSYFRVNMSSPYVITGGTFTARVYKGGKKPLDRMTVGIAGSSNLAQARQGNLQYTWVGAQLLRTDLSDFLSTSGSSPTYDFWVTFSFMADKSHGDDPYPPYLKFGYQTGIDSLAIIADIQVSPNSLPALSLGKNVVEYRDASGEGRAVRITHRWREREDVHRPAPPSKPVSPGDGDRVRGLTPELKWAAAVDADPGDKVMGYRVQVSLRPDCAWPLSSNLDKDVEKGATSFQVPEGWLNKGTTYYWRVRAWDSSRHPGDWSPIWKFTAR